MPYINIGKRIPTTSSSTIRSGAAAGRVVFSPAGSWESSPYRASVLLDAGSNVKLWRPGTMARALLQGDYKVLVMRLAS
jgi:hypothetical protein